MKKDWKILETITAMVLKWLSVGPLVACVSLSTPPVDSDRAQIRYKNLQCRFLNNASIYHFWLAQQFLSFYISPISSFTLQFVDIE